MGTGYRHTVGRGTATSVVPRLVNYGIILPMNLSDIVLYHGSAAVPISFLKVAYGGLHDLDLALAVAKVAAH